MMTREELDQILAEHKKYLAGDGGSRANLREADLRGADLIRANLIRANLREADLRGADLIRANLIRANLREANLRGANLIRADLSDADLSDADLSDADLRGADLIGADLHGADLRTAHIADAKMDEPICRIDFGGWSICIRATYTTIGCKTYPNEEWLSSEPESPRIADADPAAAKWWQIYGEAIKSAIRCVMKEAK
jgi:uncharacterized protein YjbI with pentapeptide repeats